jgi:hypothetical protein
VDIEKNRAEKSIGNPKKMNLQGLDSMDDRHAFDVAKKYENFDEMINCAFDPHEIRRMKDKLDFIFPIGTK